MAELHRTTRSLLAIDAALSRPTSMTPAQGMAKSAILLSSLLGSALVSAQSGCISLEDSTTCPAFSSASVATSGFVADLYPFLQFVSDRESFDEQLLSYVQTTFVQNK